LVTLTLKDIGSILTRFLQLELTAQDVTDWASALELRDDIKFGYDDEGAVFTAIFKLATPELEGPLTMQRAESLIHVLSSKKMPTDEDISNAYERR